MESKETGNWPSEDEAKDYLKQHKIIELFEEISAHLLFRQPANPKEFIIEHIEKIKAARNSKKEFPYFFTDKDVQATIRIIDPLGKGFITLEQYKDAMKSLGINDYNQNPSTAVNNKVSTEQFRLEAQNCLHRMLSAFGKEF